MSCSPSSSQASLGPRLLPGGEKENKWNFDLTKVDHTLTDAFAGKFIDGPLAEHPHMEIPFRVERLERQG